MMVIAWVVLAAIGLLFALKEAGASLNRYILLRGADVDDERLSALAFNTAVGQSVYAVLLLLFLGIGINAMVGSNSTFFIWSMFSAEVVVVAGAIQSRRFRKKLFRSGDEGTPRTRSDD